MCRTCAEKGLTKICAHSDMDKSFISCYTLDEIAYAVCSLNYKILNTYEAYVYSQHTSIFKTFMHMLAKYKVRQILCINSNYHCQLTVVF
jgi:hypothetical protein